MIRQKLQHLHYALQLLITDMMLRSTDEQKELFRKTFLIMSFMEDNKLMRAFSFSPPPPPKPTGKRKLLDLDYIEWAA
jgi:hypothetical protein